MVNCEERRGAGFFSFFHCSPFAIHHTEVPPSQRGSTRLSPFKRGQILLFHSPFTIHHSQFRSASIPTRTLYPLSFTLSSGYRRRILRTGSCLIGRGADRRSTWRRCRRRSRGAGLRPDNSGSLFQPPLQTLLHSLGEQVHPQDEVTVHGQENLDIEPAVEEVFNGAGRSRCPFLEVPVQPLRLFLLPPLPPMEALPEGSRQHRQHVLGILALQVQGPPHQRLELLQGLRQFRGSGFGVGDSRRGRRLRFAFLCGPRTPRPASRSSRRR